MAAVQSLEQWLCCPVDMLEATQLVKTLLIFILNMEFWSEFIWSEALAPFACVYFPVWLPQYVFHFLGSFSISLKSDYSKYTSCFS